MESYPMTSGDGPTSYFKNSGFQKVTIDGGKKLIQEAIENKLDDLLKNVPNSQHFMTLNIVDFGCSVGPNTFVAMQNIIEAIETKQNKNQQPPPLLELQVFFNDHANNDFNTLLKNLPYPRQYIAVAVPGSFHGRLFPKSSIHIGHSSTALHWLSRVPREVLDPTSSAWNKNSIYCSGLESGVVRAYSAQFERDIEQFLSARAEELVPGGLMAISMPGLPSQILPNVLLDLLGSSLMDMENTGLTSKEKVEAFNMPFYLPRVKELEAIIKKNRYYSIERIEELQRDPDIKIEIVVSSLRAGTEELIKQHFGIQIIDPVFNRLMEKASDISLLPGHYYKNSIDIFVLVKRNAV